MLQVRGAILHTTRVTGGGGGAGRHFGAMLTLLSNFTPFIIDVCFCFGFEALTDGELVELAFWILMPWRLVDLPVFRRNVLPPCSGFKWLSIVIQVMLCGAGSWVEVSSTFHYH